MRTRQEVRRCLCGKDEVCSLGLYGSVPFSGWGVISKTAKMGKGYEHDLCPECMKKHEALFPVSEELLPNQVEEGWGEKFRFGRETGETIGREVS